MTLRDAEAAINRVWRQSGGILAVYFLSVCIDLAVKENWAASRLSKMTGYFVSI